ncbi:3-keto-5-aminohexanoate cleavage protein [Azospirillum sp. SYSU D00513]|uniref:3-keto-5-aminohexanoate cleavage protein n=1 Tax=Azospirillum sp. SYSU D00513 TaxID=2812561 RepID=UPI001A974887|nr:3-keto-5-aminohexanoate cleavage protein [Azospirillum sp. SYSU D00513]
MQPTIITVAVNGSVPRKKDNPAVPITPEEVVASTKEAFAAGATVLHVHARNPDESSSSDPTYFAAVQEGVRRECPGMIVQFSTGGRGRDPAARGSALHHRPDMASLSTGSVNFPNMVYENHPELIASLAASMLEYSVKPEIEVFDLSMLYVAKEMADKGKLKTPLHVQFVMGMRNGMPARREALEFMLRELNTLLPGSTWTVAGIGRNQALMHEWALDLGGHIRTGLEDNIRISADRLAASNAELVALAADICRKRGSRPATAAEARALLSLPGV